MLATSMFMIVFRFFHILAGVLWVGSAFLFVAAALVVAAPEVAEKGGYASVNGVKLYYEERGMGAPVVLLHGGINTLETTFATLMPELARKYRVVAIEQVGHGHSPDTELPRTYAEMADDTAALLGHLSIARADLIGWSDGGIIAFLVAIRHPERVRRVVASGANMRLEGLSPGFVRWARAVAPDDKGLEKLRLAYERVSPDGAIRRRLWRWHQCVWTLSASAV